MTFAARYTRLYKYGAVICPPSSAHPSAVNHEHMAVNVITRRGRKKHGGSTNVVRFSPSRRWDAFENLAVANFIALQRGGVVGAHVARRDRVHVHALRCPFVGQRFGQLHDRPLGRSIRRNGIATLKSKQRSDIDYFSARSSAQKTATCCLA